jgi:hypothetical protein
MVILPSVYCGPDTSASRRKILYFLTARLISQPPQLRPHETSNPLVRTREVQVKLRTLSIAGGVAVAAALALGIQATAVASAPIDGPKPIKPPVQNVLPFPSQSETVFQPVTPTRILDTRTSTGGHLGKITSGAPFALQVTGGVVPAGASAVAFNVTVTGSTATSVLTIYPTGGAVPTVSNINYETGQVIANFATVKLSAAGQMTIKPSAGETHVLVDVAGYYARSTALGASGYAGWAYVGGSGSIGASHANNAGAITVTRNSTGDYTVNFANAQIGAFLAATANIQVTAFNLLSGSTNTCHYAGALTVSSVNLNVVVRCFDTSDGTLADNDFEIMVTG